MAGDPYWDKVALHCPFDTNLTDYGPSTRALTVSGNTAVSSAQSKWGVASAAFDGTGDYLTTPYTSAGFQWWGTYTIEMWVYPVSLSSFSYLDGANQLPAAVGNANPASNVNYWSFGPISDGKVRFYYYNGAANFVTSTATVTANQWNHIAVVISPSGIVVYVNGVGTNAVAVSGTPQESATYPLAIGQINNQSINGYIQDLKIYKGYAKYTANFTPATAALPRVPTRLSGTAKDSSNAPASRVIRAYRRTGGALIGTATSDPTTGAWSIDAPIGTDKAYVIELDGTAGDPPGTPSYDPCVIDYLTPV